MRLLIVVVEVIVATLTAPINHELSENEIVFLPNFHDVNVSVTNSSQDKLKSTAYHKENVNVLNSITNNIEVTALAIEKQHVLNIIDVAFDNVPKFNTETDNNTHITEKYFRVQPKNSVTEMEVMEAFDRKTLEIIMTGPSNRELNVASKIGTTIVPDTAASDFGTTETSQLDVVVSSNLGIAAESDVITTVFDNFTTVASDIDIVEATYIDRSVTAGITKTIMSDVKTAGLSNLNMAETADIETTIKSDYDKTVAAYIGITTATDSDTTVTSDFDTVPSAIEIPVSTDIAITLAADIEITMRSFIETTVATDIANIVAADVGTTISSVFETTITSDCNTTSVWNIEITSIADNGSNIASNIGTNIVPDLSTTIAADTGTALASDIETIIPSDIDTTLDANIVISIVSDIKRPNATTEHIRWMSRDSEKPLVPKKEEPQTEVFIVTGSNITNDQDSLPETPKPDEYYGNYINSQYKEIPKHTYGVLLTEVPDVLEIKVANNKPRFDLDNLLVADLDERPLDIVQYLDKSVELDSNYDLDILLDNFDDEIKDEIKISNDILIVDTRLEFNDINMIIEEYVNHGDFSKRGDDLDNFDVLDDHEKFKQYLDMLINDNINKVSRNTVRDYVSNMKEHSGSVSDDSTVFIYLEGLELANILNTLVTEEEENFDTTFKMVPTTEINKERSRYLNNILVNAKIYK